MTQPHTDAPDTAQHEPTIDELQQQLASRERTIATLQRRQSIDAQLLNAGTIDLDATRMLAERSLDEHNDADVGTVIAELKSNRPYLFQAPTPPPSNIGARSPRLTNHDMQRHDETEHAKAALQTGSRDDLMRYLRLRRA